MLMEGFLAVTAVLEPHLRFRPAAAPESCSASALPEPGDDLLPSLTREKKYSVNPHIWEVYEHNTRENLGFCTYC